MPVNWNSNSPVNNFNFGGINININVGQSGGVDALQLLGLQALFGQNQFDFGSSRPDAYFPQLGSLPAPGLNLSGPPAGQGLTQNDDGSVTTAGGFRIEAHGERASWTIYGPDGKELTNVWGDPHVQEADEEDEESDDGTQYSVKIIGSNNFRVSPDRRWARSLEVKDLKKVLPERFSAEATFVLGNFIEPYSGIFECPDLVEMREAWGNTYSFSARPSSLLMKPPVSEPKKMQTVWWMWCNVIDIPPFSGWRGYQLDSSITRISQADEMYNYYKQIFQPAHTIMSERGGGRNVLFFDGHVEYHSERRIEW